MTDTTWHNAILDTMTRLVGAEQTAKVNDAWREHEARTRPEVTFLGPYSSGKSTLLRRLVVDGGAAVPDWLTISARRETFELNAVDVGELTFTDAPGFAAGSELHDELAQDALALSDFFLLVVPPQLLTTNRDLVGSILSGKYFFGEARPGNERIVIAVIAQADSMGIDPDDDVEGMRRLAERKRLELVAQLAGSAGMPMPELQVFCVAADPYEAQARQPNPQRTAFDPYRDWDGINGLTAALHELPRRHAELKRAAGVRYFCRLAIEVAAQARTVVDDLQSTADELRARHTQLTLQRSQVDAIVDAARADLEGTLVSLAGTLSEELGTNRAEARSQIDERMGSTLDQWARRWDAEVDLVLGEASAQIDERLSRPRARRTEEFLRSLTVSAGAIDAPTTNSRVVSLLNEIKVEFDSIARRTLEVCAGDTLEHLLAGGKTAASRSADSAARQAIAHEASTRARRAAQRLEASVQITEAVMTVITVLDTERRRQAVDEQLRRDRYEARERIVRNAATASADIVDGVNGAPGWRARSDTMLGLLRERLGLTAGDTAIDDLTHAVATQRELTADLSALIAGAPVAH